MTIRTLFSRRPLLKSLIAILLHFLPALILNAGSPQKHALLIGINDYKLSGLKSLSGPINDVTSIRSILVNRLAFQEKNITLLTDSQASHRGLEKAFRDLANKINNGDLVYIHFCGHGSRIPDLNGDEYPGKYDQTWVPYGARNPHMKGKDRLDICDDEIHLWLQAILEKTSHLVFVSDSCHSATLWRGREPVARSVPMNPLQEEFPNSIGRSAGTRSGIYIGASQDDGQAYESTFNGKIHGLFSWYWAQSLSLARANHTWRDIFLRTQALLTNRIENQRPQFKAPVNEDKNSGKIAISRVWDNGRKVRIEAGKLSGIFPGSLFILDKAAGNQGSQAALCLVTRATAHYSEARGFGEFKSGDLVTHLGGGPFLDTLFDWLSLCLPCHFPFLKDGFEGEKSWQILRAKYLEDLDSHGTPGVQLNVMVRKKGSLTPYKANGSEDIPVFSRNSLLTFQILNHSHLDFYVYLLVITEDGQIIPIHPFPGEVEQSAFIGSGILLDLVKSRALLLDRPGKELIKMVISEKPIAFELWAPSTERVSSPGHLGPFTGESRVLKGLGRRWAAKEFSFIVSKGSEGE